MPSVHASVSACVCLSRFYINLNISFIYKDISTKFAGKVYGYKTRQNGPHSRLFENNKDSLDLELLSAIFIKFAQKIYGWEI